MCYINIITGCPRHRRASPCTARTPHSYNITNIGTLALPLRFQRLANSADICQKGLIYELFLN